MKMKWKTLIVICISALPFLFTLEGDFVFDDSEAVLKNKDITSGSWTDPFFHDFWGADIKSDLSHKSYRPLTILSYRLDYFLSDRTFPSAYKFKITNLTCHILCCLLVWEVFETILNETKTQGDGNKVWWKDTAFLSTLLFAVHPVHVEAVSGVVGRADLMAAMTFFYAFVCYNKSLADQRHSFIYLLLTVILAGMSMLYKENGITVLGFCLVYELLTKCRIKIVASGDERYLSLRSRSKYSILRTTNIISSIVALLYGRWLVMDREVPKFNKTDNPAAFADSFFVQVFTYNYIYFINVLLFIWPQWLCYDWSMGCIQLIETVLDKRMFLPMLLYMYGILLYGIYLFQAILKMHNSLILSSRAMVLAGSLIIIPFFPASNVFFPVGFVIAERILYIPSAGYCLLVGIGFRKLLKLLKEIAPPVCRKIAVFMFLYLLLIYGLKSWHRSKDWQSEYSLFTSGLAVCPLNAKVHYNVAKVADAKHDTAWALAEYKEAIRLFPEYYQAMNNLANLLKNQKQYDEAEQYLKLALTQRKDFPAAWMNFGILLATTRRFAESEYAYKTALSYRRQYPDCFYNLGNLYLEVNKTEEAITCWYQAISLNPKHVLAWTNILALMDNTGQIERALKIIPYALEELPDSPPIHFALANIYGKMNRFDEAETHFLKAIKLFDKDVKAIHFANLGVLYHRWKKYSSAIVMYRNALHIDPTFKTAQKNLKSIENLENK